MKILLRTMAIKTFMSFLMLSFLFASEELLILNRIHENFLAATSQQSKLAIITAPIDDSAYGLPCKHGLSLAISLGKPGIVEDFIKCVDDINGEKLDVFGYRQPYTVAHVAMHPNYILSNHISETFDPAGASLHDRLKIIHLLGQKGADFNIIRENNGYKYHPLQLGSHSGTCILNDVADGFRARGLLYGADFLHPEYEYATGPYPAICSFEELFADQSTAYKIFVQNIFNSAFDQYVSLSIPELEKTRLAASTKSVFRIFQERKIAELKKQN
jgi:hypothetical protein